MNRSNGSNGLKSSGISLESESEADPLEELNSKNGIGLELVGLLHEILIRSGTNIRLAISQHYFAESQNYQISIKRPLSLRESKKQDTNYIKLHSAKSSPTKDIEAFCEEYTEMFKVYKSKEFNTIMSNIPTQTSLYFDLLVANSKSRVPQL